VTAHTQGAWTGVEERQLVEAAQRGDQEAFEALVVRYQDRIFRLVQRLVSGTEAVEDIAQEVFIRAYRSLRDFKGEASFYTWIYKIAVNLCRNFYRTRARRPGTEPLDENDAGGFESAGPTPEEEVFRREFWEQLRRGLDELPAEQREAVVCCDLEGMSYEEMADVLAVPIGTVRSRIFRGRRALQQHLAAFQAGRPGGKR
jgi:RNA polymerase sigma-70 factor (ECF subfamily)